MGEDHFNHRVAYYYRWDSEYCFTCRMWIDEECDDPNCDECLEPRPDKPF